ncbi:hypothetical protein GCM10022405_12040 [Gibbsiella dentisursi]|uniref:Uncharacterized protein n=1 Tax=Gibbsiella dentisursi TaxID=796890 RepID=A0ABP7KXE0_9GAMM
MRFLTIWGIESIGSMVRGKNLESAAFQTIPDNLLVSSIPRRRAANTACPLKTIIATQVIGG